MPKAAQIYRYEAGQRNCPVCNDPLPAHETWPGARYRFCGKPECADVVKTSPAGIYIAQDERRCDGPQCENFLAPGFTVRPPVFSQARSGVRTSSNGKGPTT
jgi:hypothetical protein